MFKDRIKELRNETGLSLRDFATVIGVSYQSIRLYEAGEMFPKKEIIDKICALFRVDEEWLIGRKAKKIEEMTQEEIDDVIARAKEIGVSRFVKETGLPAPTVHKLSQWAAKLRSMPSHCLPLAKERMRSLTSVRRRAASSVHYCLLYCCFFSAGPYPAKISPSKMSEISFPSMVLGQSEESISTR